MTDLEPCALGLLLLRKFAVGKLSAIEVQEIAQAAWQSGLESPDIQELRGLGAMGHQAGNCHRDLLRKFCRGLTSPSGFKTKVEMMKKEEKNLHVAEELEASLLLPHEWILHLQESDLLGKMSCTNEELVCFWKSQLSSPQMSPDLKEMIKGSMPSQLPIPWLLHGDGAPFTEVDSIQVLSFRPWF